MSPDFCLWELRNQQKNPIKADFPNFGYTSISKVSIISRFDDWEEAEGGLFGKWVVDGSGLPALSLIHISEPTRPY